MSVPYTVFQKGEGYFKDTVSLELNNGKMLTCEILTGLCIENQKYIILLPSATDIDDSDFSFSPEDILLYRFIEQEGEDPSLENITDDAEYIRVADACDDWLSKQDLEYEEED